MIIGFYNGVTGMIAHQEQMNVVAHNIANVNTIGFKAGRSSFADLMYTQMNTKVDGENLVGHGVKHQETDLLFGEASVTQTDYALDFAITGEGFFAVDHNGTTEYTRNGCFTLSANGNTNYLVTSDGSYVLDSGGRRIRVPRVEGSSNVPDTTEILDKLGIYTFTNPYGLEPVENVRFVPTDNSGEAVALKSNNNPTNIKALQGFTEMSGVELSSEMVNMISAQRGFQFNTKVVQTADAMDEMINNLR